MAHFAELDNNNKVIRVVVLDNKNCQDATGNEVESIGIAFCQKLWGGTWVQTSYNKNFRGKFAGLDDIWNGTNFVEPTPVIEETPID